MFDYTVFCCGRFGLWAGIGWVLVCVVSHFMVISLKYSCLDITYVICFIMLVGINCSEIYFSIVNIIRTAPDTDVFYVY